MGGSLCVGAKPSTVNFHVLLVASIHPSRWTRACPLCYICLPHSHRTFSALDTARWYRRGKQWAGLEEGGSEGTCHEVCGGSAGRPRPRARARRRCRRAQLAEWQHEELRAPRHEVVTKPCA